MDRSFLSQKRCLSDETPSATPTKRRRTLSTTTAEASQQYKDDECSVLADAPMLQDIWDSLPAGIVFEITRLSRLHNVDLSRVTEGRLKPLTSLNNKEGLKYILNALAIETTAAPKLMDERVADVLDWEADSHTKGDGTCLDCTFDSRRISGSVTFAGVLSMENLPVVGKAGDSTANTGSGIRLLPPRLSESCLFTRTGGSHRFFRLKIADRQRFRTKADQERLWAFCCKPIVLLGRVFLPFIEKNDTVWYYLAGFDRLGQWAEKQNEVVRGLYGMGKTIKSVEDLVQWWIPFTENKDQLLSKLITRLHLGISDTKPGLFIQDITVPDDITHDGVVFSDGSGLISQPAAQAHQEKLFSHLKIPLSAYQIRISTAKGVVQIPPSNLARSTGEGRKSTSWLSLSKSMVKSRRRKEQLLNDGPELLGQIPILQAAHFVVCINREASIRHPANLSKQLIPILCEQGVNVRVIGALQRRDITRIITSLLLPHGDNQLEFAKSIQTEAKLIYRAQMEEFGGSLHPVHVRSKSNADQWGLEDIVPAAEDDGSNIIYANSNLCDHQKLYLAVITGFNIRSSHYFLRIWEKLVKQSVMKGSADFRIQVDGSCYAMIVPDFTGELPEGFISFAPPKIISDAQNNEVDFKSGDVLVGRHPALLPTDIRKVKLANIPFLRQRPGIIFFSTQGKRPLAEILSGGDYDGDEVILIWDQSLVVPFKNADLSLANKIKEVDQSFEKDETTVEMFMEQLERTDHASRQQFLQQRLLSSLRVPRLHGLYNKYLLKAIDKYGLGSWHARSLAQKCNMLLDAPKTSHRLLDSVKVADDKMYNILPDPRWKTKSDAFKLKREVEETGRISSNYKNPLSKLSAEGAKFFENQFSLLSGERETRRVQDKEQHMKLQRPYLEAKSRAESSEAIRKELEAIETTVQEAHKQYTALFQKDTKPKSFNERQMRLYELNRYFILNPSQEECPFFWCISGDDLQKVKASYAYVWDTRSDEAGSKGGFAWQVAALPLLGLLAKVPIQISYPTLARLTPHNSFTSEKSS
ncbi:hypothetical protein FS842_010740 [Serendipita sp. 407]|nr:hypothetical protein FS842_010740 [Serendipita sp. 407]